MVQASSTRRIGSSGPERGTVRIDPSMLRNKHMKPVTGRATDSRGLYPRLTARRTSATSKAALHASSRYRAANDSLCEWLDMGSFIDRRAAGFSQGERMKVSIARALVRDPQHVLSMNPRTVSMWEAPVRCDNSSVRSRARAMHHPVESRHAGGFRSVRRHRGGGSRSRRCYRQPRRTSRASGP